MRKAKVYQTRKQKNKKILITVSIMAALLIIIGGAVTVFFKARHSQRGTEWFEKQDEYVNELHKLADQMDTVTALYVSGSMETEDYQSHLIMLQRELNLLYYNRDQALKDKPIKVGSSTYASKKGTEAVDRLYEDFDAILVMAYNNAENADTLSYKYIASQQTIIEDISSYEAAKSIYYAEAGNG